MYLSKGKEWKRIECNEIKQPWLDVLKWRNGKEWKLMGFK